MGFFIVKVTYMNDTQYHHKAFVKQNPGLWMHHLLLFIPQTENWKIFVSPEPSAQEISWSSVGFGGRLSNKRETLGAISTAGD